ncbi:MAG: glutathione S-transferase family protein [Myxococcaceae bacterium]
MSDPVLYQLPPACGLLSFSPYCVKVQLALKLKKIPFTTVNTLFPRENPRNKVPYLVWGEKRLEDSTAIVAAIDEAGFGPKLIPSDPKLRADAHILEDWADESLYWQGVRIKFGDDEVWKRIEPEFRQGFPAWMRPMGTLVARRQTLAKLDAQGLSRRAQQLADLELEQHLDALETRLAGRAWLVGDAPSIADLAVTAMLSQLNEQVSPKHAAAIAKRPALAKMMNEVHALARG